MRIKHRSLLLPVLFGVGVLVAGAGLLARLGTVPLLELIPTDESESPGNGETGTPVEDPDALAARFRTEVMRELERTTASEGHGPVAGDAIGRQDTRESRVVASLVESGRSDGIDWSYLQDVFDGRVRGIPNERRAGLSLQEMDDLGEVPYLEELREEGRFDEVAELDVEEEPAPSNCPHQIAPGPRRDWMCGRWAIERLGCPYEIPPGPLRDQICWTWEPPPSGQGASRSGS
jgi:hypothetical protein